ncbi:hypothetical protein F5Y15DRAFT_137258 [Xylariaceae sp. FL0016]|nr:hypothetical protein F5Y15DRAFT_137258 [Xylariaceae sp. FL0016]
MASPALSLFTLFPLLPPEIRLQIWQAALSSDLPPSFVIYRHGCWHPRRLVPGDAGYHPGRYSLNLELEFRYHELEPVACEVPLLFVSREAREVAARWARRLGLHMARGNIRREDGTTDELSGRGESCHRGKPLFGRPMSAAHDALYVPQELWEPFLVEVGNRLFEPDLIDKMVSLSTSLAHLAIAEALLLAEAANIHEIFYVWPNIQVLLVVLGTQPIAEDGVSWGFRETGYESLFWKKDEGEAGGRNTVTQYTGDETLLRAMKRAVTAIEESNSLERLEIRPVYAVRRDMTA